jgi:hypothetical protein
MGSQAAHRTSWKTVATKTHNHVGVSCHPSHMCTSPYIPPACVLVLVIILVCIFEAALDNLLIFVKLLLKARQARRPTVTEGWSKCTELRC